MSAYILASIEITDAAAFEEYRRLVPVVIAAYGGRYLVRGGTREVTEGNARSRTVVLEFPSYDAAAGCYRSDGYQAAKKLRDGKAEFNLVVVEGYDGPKF